MCPPSVYLGTDGVAKHHPNHESDCMKYEESGRVSGNLFTSKAEREYNIDLVELRFD